MALENQTYVKLNGEVLHRQRRRLAQPVGPRAHRGARPGGHGRCHRRVRRGHSAGWRGWHIPKTKFERRDDVRNWVPQLSKRNIAGNQPIIDLLARFAELKGATSAQISLVWMLRKWPCVVPIPGSKNKERIVENLSAANVELTDDEFASLQAALDECEVYGHRGFGGF